MTTWKFTATGIFANDHHVGASYSLAQNGDVYVYTGIVDPADGTARIPVRLRIAPDMPSYAAAVEAAKAAEKPAQPAKQAVPTDWVGSRIDGKGWYVVFDDAAKRTRSVFAQKPTDAQAAAIAAAGNDCRCHYLYTSRRAAERNFRRDFGLQGRHFLHVVIA